MAQTVKRYMVLVRNYDDGTLTPVYEWAISAKEAATIVRNFIDESCEEIEEVWTEVKNWK